MDLDLALTTAFAAYQNGPSAATLAALRQAGSDYSAQYGPLDPTIQAVLDAGYHSVTYTAAGVPIPATTVPATSGFGISASGVTLFGMNIPWIGVALVGGLLYAARKKR